MADKDKIISLPNKHLRQRSKTVGVIDDATRELARNMEAAALDWEDSRQHEVGVALAAVQIDKMVRVVIVRNNFDDKEDRSFRVLINPEITKFEGEPVEDFEGCLSIKDVYGKVLRHPKITLKALNLEGKTMRMTATGFLARVLQHEVDHTNGVVFIDHIKDEPEAFFRLTDEGKLEPLDYDKDVKNNRLLW